MFFPPLISQRAPIYLNDGHRIGLDNVKGKFSNIDFHEISREKGIVKLILNARDQTPLREYYVKLPDRASFEKYCQFLEDLSLSCRCPSSAIDLSKATFSQPNNVELLTDKDRPYVAMPKLKEMLIFLDNLRAEFYIDELCSPPNKTSISYIAQEYAAKRFTSPIAFERITTNSRSIEVGNKKLNVVVTDLNVSPDNQYIPFLKKAVISSIGNWGNDPLLKPISELCFSPDDLFSSRTFRLHETAAEASIKEKIIFFAKEDTLYFFQLGGTKLLTETLDEFKPEFSNLSDITLEKIKVGFIVSLFSKSVDILKTNIDYAAKLTATSLEKQQIDTPSIDTEKRLEYVENFLVEAKEKLVAEVNSINEFISATSDKSLFDEISRNTGLRNIERVLIDARTAIVTCDNKISSIDILSNLTRNYHESLEKYAIENGTVIKGGFLMLAILGSFWEMPQAAAIIGWDYTVALSALLTVGVASGILWQSRKGREDTKKP